MRPSRNVTLAAASLVLAACVLTIFSVRGASTRPPQESESHKSSLNWKPEKIRISLADARLDLELPDLSADADWIVGVQPTEGDDKETISAGLISWEDSDKNPALAGKPFKIKTISGVADYPRHQVRNSRGRVSLPNLAHFDGGSGSLIVLVKVTPGTHVRVRRGGKEFKSVGDSFIVHNGVIDDRPVKGLHSLVGRLIRSKLLATKVERGAK